MKKFMTGSYYGKKSLIDEVEVERETDASVWINGSRSSKRSGWLNYFDTWEDAKTYLLESSESKLSAIRRSLEVAQGAHGNIKGLKKPQGIA